MASPRVLLSGDYWHADFRDLIARMTIPTTLTPLDKLKVDDTQRFSIILIAQSRSNQFDQSIIDSIVASNPLTPVVMLLGSWCEGERRSDRPVEGVKRVFWHQWQGRFKDFSRQMRADGVSVWHAPATETDADRVLTIRHNVGFKTGFVIGISAQNKQTYDALAQGVDAIGGKPKWVERVSWINLTASATAICIDADSLDAALERRIKWLQNKLSHAPMVVLMNFPRRQEVEQLNKLGVGAVVSKPFELNDLRSAITSAVESNAVPRTGTSAAGTSATGNASGVPRPSFIKRRTSIENVE